jgi:hypothetical protein
MNLQLPPGRRGLRMSWKTVLASIAVLAIVVIVGRVNWFKGIHDFFLSWVTTNLGMDFFAAEAVAVLLTAAAISAIPSFVLFFLFGVRRKQVGLAAVILTTVGAGSVYTVGRNTCFDRETGKARRYYAITPNGPKFSSKPGYDPQFRTPYVPITPEAATKFGGNCAVYGSSGSESHRSDSDAASKRPDAEAVLEITPTGSSSRQNPAGSAETPVALPRLLRELPIQITGLDETDEAVLSSSIAEAFAGAGDAVLPSSAARLTIKASVSDVGPLIGGVAGSRGAFRWSVVTRNGSLILQGGVPDVPGTGVTNEDAHYAILKEAGKAIGQAVVKAARY